MSDPNNVHDAVEAGLRELRRIHDLIKVLYVFCVEFCLLWLSVVFENTLHASYQFLPPFPLS